MKNNIFKSLIIIVIGLFCLQGAIFAQATKTSADSLEKARLAVRSAQFLARRAEQQQALKTRAAALKIPMTIQEGTRTYSLRSITPAGEPIYDSPDNRISVQTVHADEVKNGGALRLALTGAGQTLGIWEAFDNGNASVRATHVEFGGRVTVMDGGGSSDHGTHVAGTMIASGVDNDAEGFSTGADLISYDLNNDLSEMATAAQAATPIRISNHSYGVDAGWRFNSTTGVYDWTAGSATEDWRFGAYNDDARDWDETAYDNPFLTIFKSAGNDRNDGPGPMPVGPLQDGGALGFDCISTYGTAKNIVTVGAVNDIPGGYSSPGDVTMSTFSSWGPTDDGRIKPDIVANGVSLHSSIGTGDTDYDEYSGTSMASPSAAGGSGLLLEHWANVIGGAPRSATLKGLLIEMADEAGGAVGPDYTFGWGLINVADAAQLITIEGYDGCQQYVEGSVSDGDVFTHDIYSDGTQPIKVTLTWNDVAATNTNNGTLNPAGANYLVNNLDLRVVSGGGTTFEPWVLDPANPTNPAFAGDNNRDNVEQVLVVAPVAGVYTIKVFAPATVEDGPQRFTLWFSGNGSADEDITVSGVNINNDRTFAARRNIVFGPLPVNITAPAHVRAYAGKSVKLMPGFHAFSGSTFRAKIIAGGGCGTFSGELKTDNYAGFKQLVLEPNERSPFSQSAPISPAMNLSVTPNPTSGWLQVNWQLENTILPATLHILDQQGKEILRQSASTTNMRFNLEQLTPGVYSCIVENGGEKVSQQFVVGR